MECCKGDRATIVMASPKSNLPPHRNHHNPRRDTRSITLFLLSGRVGGMSTKRLGLSFIILATILLGVHTFSRATVVGNTASLSKIEARGVTAQETAAATTSAASPSPTGVLNVFQLSTPVLGSQSLRDAFVGNSTSNATAIDPNASGINCQVTLMRFDFANSFGKPFIGKTHRPIFA